MVDCVGKELKIGDKVVCSDMRYADLLIGEIIDFTPKKARVRYTRSEHQSLPPHEQLKESYQIFKYSDSEVVGAIFATKEKQIIEEIRTVIEDTCKTAGEKECERLGGSCYTCEATRLYEAGYRKQAEGEWINRDEKTWCSLCGASNKQYKPPYCPHCGAKMKGGVQE